MMPSHDLSHLLVNICQEFDIGTTAQWIVSLTHNSETQDPISDLQNRYSFMKLKKLVDNGQASWEQFVDFYCSPSIDLSTQKAYVSKVQELFSVAKDDESVRSSLGQLIIKAQDSLLKTGVKVERILQSLPMFGLEESSQILEQLVKNITIDKFSKEHSSLVGKWLRQIAGPYENQICDIINKIAQEDEGLSYHWLLEVLNVIQNDRVLGVAIDLCVKLEKTELFTVYYENDQNLSPLYQVYLDLRKNTPFLPEIYKRSLLDHIANLSLLALHHKKFAFINEHWIILFHDRYYSTEPWNTFIAEWRSARKGAVASSALGAVVFWSLGKAEDLRDIVFEWSRLIVNKFIIGFLLASASEQPKSSDQDVVEKIVITMNSLGSECKNLREFGQWFQYMSSSSFKGIQLLLLQRELLISSKIKNLFDETFSKVLQLIPYVKYDSIYDSDIQNFCLTTFNYAFGLVRQLDNQHGVYSKEELEQEAQWFVNLIERLLYTTQFNNKLYFFAAQAASDSHTEDFLVNFHTIILCRLSDDIDKASSYYSGILPKLQLKVNLENHLKRASNSTDLEGLKELIVHSGDSDLKGELLRHYLQVLEKQLDDMAKVVELLPSGTIDTYVNILRLLWKLLLRSNTKNRDIKILLFRVWGRK